MPVEVACPRVRIHALEEMRIKCKKRVVELMFINPFQIDLRRADDQDPEGKRYQQPAHPFVDEIPGSPGPK